MEEFSILQAPLMLHHTFMLHNTFLTQPTVLFRDYVTPHHTILPRLRVRLRDFAALNMDLLEPFRVLSDNSCYDEYCGTQENSYESNKEMSVSDTLAMCSHSRLGASHRDTYGFCDNCQKLPIRFYNSHSLTCCKCGHSAKQRPRNNKHSNSHLGFQGADGRSQCDFAKT
jgi:hypothetical protein